MKYLLLIAIVAGAAFGCVTHAESPTEKLGWNVAIHSYTYKAFTFEEAVDKTASLGLRHMSISGNIKLKGNKPKPTMSMSEEEITAVKGKLSSAGIVKLVNLGVIQLSADEPECRKTFEWAKRMGINTLVAEPKHDALDTIEKLCIEYNIKVAIHNHPKPSIYWNPDTVLEAVKGRSPLMGACADTGHWVRSGLDPVECLRKLEGRILALHFKDLSAKPETGAKPHDVPWGTGISNARGMMAELKRQKFRGSFCVEYEYNWENSTPEIAQCVDFFNNSCAELAR